MTMRAFAKSLSWIYSNWTDNNVLGPETQQHNSPCVAHNSHAMTSTRKDNSFFWITRFTVEWQGLSFFGLYDRHFNNNNRKEEGSYLIRLRSFLFWFQESNHPSIYGDLYVNKFIAVYFIGRTIFKEWVGCYTGAGWNRSNVVFIFHLFSLNSLAIE